MPQNNEAQNEERPEGLLSSTPEIDEAKALLKKNQKQIRAYGRVNVGLFFEEKVLTFSPNELRFLKEFGPETTVEDAAKKAGVTVLYANRFLKSQKAREFLTDKFQQVAIQHGWTVERWFAEGDRVWRGLKAVTREQLDIWKEFGARLLPKRVAGGSDGTEKPQITINIGAVDEAFRRQKEIQAEIIDATARTL